MSDEIPRVAYFVLLLIALGGYLIVEFRANPGKSLRQMLAWGLIFLGLIAGFGLWEDIRNDVAPRQIVDGGRIELPKQDDGHFYIDMRLNGEAVEFMVDTGATQIALSPSDAERIGLDPETLSYSQMVATANGTAFAAPVRIDSIKIGGITDRDVAASVTDAPMDISLLGMSYLSRFARVSFEGEVMVLER